MYKYVQSLYFSCLPLLLVLIWKRYITQRNIQGKHLYARTVFAALYLSSVRLALSRTRLLTRAAKGFMCRTHSKSGDSIGESENENKDYIPLVSLRSIPFISTCMFVCHWYELMAENVNKKHQLLNDKVYSISPNLFSLWFAMCINCKRKRYYI